MKIPRALNFMSIFLFAVSATQNKWQPTIYASGSINFFLSPVLSASLGQRYGEGRSVMSATANLLMSMVSHLFILYQW